MVIKIQIKDKTYNLSGRVYYSKLQFRGTLAHKFYADDLIIAYDRGWW